MYTVEELAQVRNIDNSSLSGAGKAEYTSAGAGEWGDDILGLSGYSLAFIFSAN